jgi:hypothetical protein
MIVHEEAELNNCIELSNTRSMHIISDRPEISCLLVFRIEISDVY